ncbi:MAG: transketolase [Puniceicoccales bacterium]|jgi:transketolase|nr:transketolase [Puniceicoccales bacterium]
MIQKDPVALSKKVRLHALAMIRDAKSSHIGSNFSIADILSVLYGKILNIDPKQPKKEDRDRFLLSKGHATAILYAILAECGFFPVHELKTFYQAGSLFLGHTNCKVYGIEFSTGSLGHALSVAAGIALAAQWRKKVFRTFVLLSDGECDEGSNWEAILFAAHHRLGNLTVIVDYNKIQSLDTIANTLALEPFRAKWEAFGWEVLECDGHNPEQLERCLKDGFKDKHHPHVLIAHTVKGKGVSFMENTVLWHYRSPQGEEYEAAKDELRYA